MKSYILGLLLTFALAYSFGHMDGKINTEQNSIEDLSVSFDLGVKQGRCEVNCFRFDNAIGMVLTDGGCECATTYPHYDHY